MCYNTLKQIYLFKYKLCAAQCSTFKKSSFFSHLFFEKKVDENNLHLFENNKKVVKILIGHRL